MFIKTETVGDFTRDSSLINLEALKRYLLDQTEPVWESLLLNAAFEGFNSFESSALELYRKHFLLFHALYRLAEEFYSEGLYLHVHFMRTFLRKFPAEGWCRYFNDELEAFCKSECDSSAYCEFHKNLLGEKQLGQLSDRYFYFDQENYCLLSEETAEAFINGAWELLCNYEDFEECYRILGMPGNSTLESLKHRFRFLAKTLHPDVSKDSGKEFSRVNTAYRKLERYLLVRKQTG